MYMESQPSLFASHLSESLDHPLDFPKGVNAVESAFYVDNYLTGADSIDEAIGLHHQLLNLLVKGGFLLRKWSSSDPAVLRHISPELRDPQSTHHMPSPDGYTKTLSIECNANLDHFCLTVASLQESDNVTKQALISDIAKTFDALGWFSPTIIKAKILLQRLWESRIGWDTLLPPAIYAPMEIRITSAVRKTHLPSRLV